MTIAERKHAITILENSFRRDLHRYRQTLANYKKGFGTWKLAETEDNYYKFINYLEDEMDTIILIAQRDFEYTVKNIQKYEMLLERRAEIIL